MVQEENKSHLGRWVASITAAFVIGGGAFGILGYQRGYRDYEEEASQSHLLLDKESSFRVDGFNTIVNAMNIRGYIPLKDDLLIQKSASCLIVRYFDQGVVLCPNHEPRAYAYKSREIPYQLKLEEE